MKKRIAALTLAAIMLCSCSANVTEENATTSTTAATDNKEKQATDSNYQEALESQKRTNELFEQALKEYISDLENQDSLLDDILNLPDKNTEATTKTPEIKEENYYESYDVLHKCTYPTKNNNGTYCVYAPSSDKTRRYFLDPSFIDYYYEYDIGYREGYLVIDNYIYHHQNYNNELQLLRFDTYTGKNYSVNNVNLDTMDWETNYALGDDNKLYVITLAEKKFVEENSDGANIKKDYIHSLEALDLKTLSSKKLFDFEKNVECEILAVYKNKAYIGKRDKEYKTTVYELDLETKIEKKIFEESYGISIFNGIGIYDGKPYIFYTDSYNDNISLYMSGMDGKSEMLYSSKNGFGGLYIIDNEIYFELRPNDWTALEYSIVYKINSGSAEFVGFSDNGASYIFKNPYNGELQQVYEEMSYNYRETVIGPLEY